ncbi:MAG: hypothetical protein JNJ57_07140, partial [Saprospiraceae bacterium]|nr:hypothetical protein [Saprospiraceae bacterium]
MYVHISDTPLDFFPYHIVALGGRRDEDGNRLLEKTSLEILTGIFSASNLDVDALIVTSDLQGTVVQNGEEWLLGEKLPEFLKMLLEIQFPQIGTHRVGVVLCGDLYANLEKRGGIGDVREVWLQFKANFAWVAGVAGNHDHFGAKSDCAIFKRTPGIYFCQRESRSIGKAQIAGISGIIGRPEQPNRMTQDDFLAALKQLLLRHPEFILLHEGPDYP